MGDWNEEIVKFKEKKRGIVEQRPVPAHKKKHSKKPWKITVPAFFGKGKRVTIHHTRTKEEAEAWIEKHRRSLYLPYRTQAPNVVEEIRRQHEQRISRYRIEGPTE